MTAEYNPRVTPWKIRESDFSTMTSFEEKVKFLLKYAVLAPSSHNTQPWKFAIEDERIKVSADLTRALKVADPDERELFISVGCAFTNLTIAAKRFGYVPMITYFPEGLDEDLVALIEFSKSEAERNELFESITGRHTNRSLYEDKPISREVLKKLQDCVEAGIRLNFISDTETRVMVAELVAKGDIIQYNNPAYRGELGYWVGQGVFGHKGIVAKIGKFFISHLNAGKSLGQKEKKLIQSAPVFAVLSSAKNDREIWVKIGEVYEKVALTATSLNIQQHPMNQGLTEVPEHREKLREILGIEEMPQLTFRLGYAKPTKHQVRRQLEEVLVQW